MLSKRFEYDGKECEKLNLSQLKAKKEIKAKIDSGFYKFEEINCPICCSNEKIEISQKDKYGLPHLISLCKNCGFLYASKRLDKNSYTDFYIHHFNDLDIGYSVGFDTSFQDQYNNAKNAIYPFVKDYINEGKKLNILEVGCSSGGAMQYFKELGHNVRGLDLGIDAIKYGQSKGLNLINIDLPDFESDTKFDLVIYNSVLEHISDLDAHLNKLRNILKNDAKVFIRVPGIKNLHNNSFHKFDLLNFITLPHIYYFSVTTLTNLFNKYGFKKLKSNEIIFALFEKSDMKGFKIVNDYNQVLEYIKKQNNLFKIKVKNILFKNKMAIRWILVKINLLNTVKRLLGRKIV